MTTIREEILNMINKMARRPTLSLAKVHSVTLLTRCMRPLDHLMFVLVLLVVSLQGGGRAHFQLVDVVEATATSATSTDINFNCPTKAEVEHIQSTPGTRGVAIGGHCSYFPGHLTIGNQEVLT